MKGIAWAKQNWKKVSAAAAAAVLVCGLYFGLSPVLAQGADSGAVYKEETVSRGNLTVGVTESGSASLETKIVSYPVAVEVEEVYVKAGQRVTAGEALMKVDLAALQDEFSTLQNSYQSAVLKLQEAQLAQQTGAINAQYDYDSSLLSGETADSQYDYTISEINIEYNDAEDEVDSLTDQKAELMDQRSDLRTAQNAFKKAYSALEADKTTLLSDLKTSEPDIYDAYFTAVDNFSDAIMDCGGSWSSLSTLSDNDKSTEITLDGSYTQWTDYADDLYDDLTDQLSSVSGKLSTASLKLEKLESQMTLSELEAEATRNKSLLESENAGNIYEATIEQLATAVSSARATVNSYAKEIEKIRPYITDGVIIAETDGLVMSVGVSEGSSVNANSPLVSIATNTVYVLVSVSQEDIDDLELGQTVQLDFDAYSDEEFTGTVDSISYSAARMGSTSVSYSVTILVDGTPGKIYEGMTCDATFITKQEKDALYVSNRAITTASDGTQTVKVLTESGEIETRTVTTGFSDGRNVQVLSGLKEGETALIESMVNS